MQIIPQIANELGVRGEQVGAAVGLLDGGATVPFVARYRKEVTGGLDDAQLRSLQERLCYLRELEERREVVLETIREQGRLTAELKTAIEAAATKVRLEDLYRPYKPKRRTRAQLARQAGLEPLARRLLENPGQLPSQTASEYVNPEAGVSDESAALEGARQILMEEFSEEAELIGQLRERLWNHGLLGSRLVKGKQDEGAKFSDYFQYLEPIRKIPSHRALAVFRGRKSGVLKLSLLDQSMSADEDQNWGAYEGRIAAHFNIRHHDRPGDDWLQETVRQAWRKILSHLETDLGNRLRERAEVEAIRVFSQNLRDLLLAAPAGSRPTAGLDPGIRSGVKVAVVDPTGRLLQAGTLYPHEPRREWEEAIRRLAEIARQHSLELISIGNGTGSRQTDRLVAELVSRHPELKLDRVLVSEAGASVYSASEAASREFPDLDVSLRGAVSIARRLQDPLAELVKIEPKAIGVGQYQHDVNQAKLAQSLEAVVEDCVNAVGVDLNTASVPLLARVSGLNRRLAEHIVSWRDRQGSFRNRKQLKEVKGLGEKTFEQCAGFLRIIGGDNPLDASAVHPEAYPVVNRIVRMTSRDVTQLMGDHETLKQLSPLELIDSRFGEPTIRDILAELEKPGRDPRPDFKTAVFREGVEEISDLVAGMVLEGVVTNVTNFGAFVDVGVHQDGLVHVSQLSRRFVKDPREVVKTGDVVKVRVLEVDLNRKRISLSISQAEPARERPRQPRGREMKKKTDTRPQTAMAEAFTKVRK